MNADEKAVLIAGAELWAVFLEGNNLPYVATHMRRMARALESERVDVERVKCEAQADGWDVCQSVAEVTCSCHPLKPWDNPYREITEAEWYANE